MHCWIRSITKGPKLSLKYHCFSYRCLKSVMKSTSVFISSSFTALYIDTLIPPTDLKCHTIEA